MSDRDELRNWYSSPSWGYKVDKMTDEQIPIVLKRVRAIKEQARTIVMIHPITDGIDNTDHQMLMTVDDIRESDRARTTSMINQSWLHRLFRHFPEIAKLTIDITIDWPGRLPNTAVITTRDGRKYLYTSDPNHDFGTIEEI